MGTPSKKTGKNFLALFDIDGTLVQTLGAGIRGMNAAFADLYGVENALGRVPIAGRTDRVIVADVLRGAGIEPTANRIGEVRDAYLARLPAAMAEPAQGPFGVLPGVTAILGRLSATPDVAVGLLTGNFERGAKIKLDHFGLWREFAFGAFGDDHFDRRDLVPVALAHARGAGIDVSDPIVVVIGDTPLDVDCAHANGALAVGVSTGPYGRDALAAAGADLTVDTLTELNETGEWLESLVVRSPRP
jgi:phosphoglycolate phosphatase-like HAD superfamily hydrolase